MNKFSYLLIIAIVFFSFAACSQETKNKEIELTEQQELFTEMIDVLSGTVETKWINLYTIVATYKPSHIEVMTQSEIEDKAEDLAKLGYEVTKKETCVKITDVMGKELAYKCHGSKAL